MTLRDLPKARKARIVGFSSSDPEKVTRMREIGFAEGDMVETLHFGLFGGNPMSVRLNNAHIALRRDEATIITVQMIDND